jgi:hypothetical protein
MCDDLETTVEELKRKGGECGGLAAPVRFP